MAVTTAGLSTRGVKFGYAVESTAGNKPSAFTQLERCNNIAGIALSTEQIDASALEDFVTKYVAGRQDTGGTWTVTFNYTPEIETQLNAMITSYNTGKSQSTPLSTWFEVWAPNLTKGFFVVAQPPQKIPMPEIGQNGLMTVDIDFVIEEYKGTDTAIEPTAQGVSLNHSTLSIVDGATGSLTATTWPSGGTVTWESDDEDVATVNNGTVTAVDPGTCKIIASTTYQGLTYTAECEVTVTESQLTRGQRWPTGCLSLFSYLFREIKYMKRITIDNTEYKFEFSIEASLYDDCTKSVMDTFIRGGMAMGAAENNDVDNAMENLIATISNLPQKALTLFYAGLLENHSETIKSKDDAKKLLTKYIKEQNKSFSDVLGEMMELMAEDNFFDLIGLTQLTEELKTETKPNKKAGKSTSEK